MLLVRTVPARSDGTGSFGRYMLVRTVAAHAVGTPPPHNLALGHPPDGSSVFVCVCVCGRARRLSRRVVRVGTSFEWARCLSGRTV